MSWPKAGTARRAKPAFSLQKAQRFKIRFRRLHCVFAYFDSVPVSAGSGRLFQIFKSLRSERNPRFCRGIAKMEWA